MIIDFGNLSQLVKNHLDEHYDHATILGPNDEDLVDALRRFGFKVTVMPKEPTAEHLAYILGYELRHNLNLLCVKVEVWETETAAAVWELD